MPSRSLPSRPNLSQLKRQAQELRRRHQSGSKAAAARVLAHHPRRKGHSLQEILDQRLALSDAQSVIAREYGFADWTRLKHFVEIGARIARFEPHPLFNAAVAAMDGGDLPGLRKLLKEAPELVRARGNLEPPYHYFTAATLLHHVAGNPFRVPLPPNIVEIAQLLLDSGADAEATTIGPNSGTTMGLIITSKQATDSDAAGALMDVLLAHGAKLDVKSPGVLDTPLANYAYGAAERMIELGAKPDVCAAAALGRMDLLRDCFDNDGRLKSRPRRHKKILSERDAIGLALLFAYVSKRSDAVDFLLEKDGNWDMIGVNNGTALHRAAGGGDLAMVKRLVVKGADTSDRNNPYNATPYSWADHEKKPDVVKWMRANCRIDLHDAVGFDLIDHAVARIRENPACVNTRLDQWRIPMGTPLHHAANLKRDKIAALLLEHGADPDILAGDGRTALEIAQESGATEIVKLLQRTS